MIATKKIFHKKARFISVLQELIGINVFTADQEDVWKNHRLVLNPAFTDKSMVCVADATTVIVEKWMKILEKQNIVDIGHEMAQVTLSGMQKMGC